MSKITGETKTVFNFIGEDSRGFLVPEYQRPYSWTEKECEQLWDDLLNYAIPEGNPEKWDDNSPEYFLGPVVLYVDTETGRRAIIDGQQRITTLLLLLRAFYSRLQNGRDDETTDMRRDMEKCFWRIDEMRRIVRGDMKLLSKVATDDKIKEFEKIINDGEVLATSRSAYAVNYRFFRDRIKASFDGECPPYPSHYCFVLVSRILSHCALLPIVTEGRNSALQVFMTLNDRGLPLSDADIFKSVLYQIFDEEDKAKEYFLPRWRDLEDNCEAAFPRARLSPVNEIFIQAMQCRRGLMGITDTTTRGVRDFFEQDGYAAFSDHQFMEELVGLSLFWRNMTERNPKVLSDQTLRRLFVLSHAPNAMWSYLASAWFVAHGNMNDGSISDQGAFELFLRKITAFILAYTITTPGTNQLRMPVYPELVKIVRDEQCDFSGYLFDGRKLSLAFDAFSFTNSRPITRSMLSWWLMHDKEQPLPPPKEKFHIEHIYSVRRNEMHPLSDPDLVDALGNKSLLEGRINIQASAYTIPDKRHYYNGGGCGGRKTCVRELLAIASQPDFGEREIVARTHAIRESFIKELDELGLLADK